jgi:drug/metabolite transporter (DMT)-like permease
VVDQTLTAIVFGLASALFLGASDFTGGLATRRAYVFGVVAVAHGVGLLIVLLLALGTSEQMPSIETFGWAALAGLSGGLGVAALYRALAVGQMGVAAALTAVLSAAVPVVYGTVTEGPPSLRQLIGFGLALVSVWLLSQPESGMERPEGFGLSLFAGLAFGIGLVFIARAGENNVYWPLVGSKVTSFALMLAIALVARRTWKVGLAGKGALALVLVTASLEAAGSASYIRATQEGRLDVAAVLSALYPVSTVILAWLMLRERVTQLQTLGIAAALVSVALISGR